ncbi:MAG: hypothetical protein ACRDZ7_00400, partial [Acidimicrobiia bacterium]
RRNRAAGPGYELNARLASLEPLDDGMGAWVRAAQQSQAETNRFLGVLAGATAASVGSVTFGVS